MANFYSFSNGVTIMNCTPHPVRFQDLTGEIVTINNDKFYLINAKVEEETVNENGITYSTPTFVGTEEGDAIIAKIHLEHPGAIIIGSIIAAQAYPGQVCGMTPVPGYERVAPDSKLMRVDKFTRYKK